MKYERPYIDIFEASVELLAVSGPGATDIGAPTVESVWDEVDNTYNINNKEESYGEDWI